jgi:hypothetical protein
MTRPLAVARAGIELAARPLPTVQVRDRYRSEFLAQVHELSPADQLRFTAGVLVQAFALRAALGSSPARAEEAAIAVAAPRFSWRCQVLRLHRWVRRSTEDGGRYLMCSRCARDLYLSPAVPSGPTHVGF